MTVPYTFGTATTSIPLSNLDSNFNTPITLGNTSIYLGNTTTTIGNLTLTNATISSGNVTISNISVTTANVTTANVATLSVTGTATIATANITTGNITTLTSTSITNSGLTSGRVTYAGASGLLSDSATLTYNGTTLTATTGANFCTTSGNVGIGTSSPGQPVELVKNQNGSTWYSVINTDANTGAAAGYLMTNNTGTLGALQLNSSTNATIGAGNAVVLRTLSTNPLVFGTNSTERMRIDSSGNVGIGTSSPATALDVNGQITASNTIFSNGGFSGQGAYVQRNSTGGGTLGSLLSSGSVTFETNATERMRIDSSGNVGIGTNSPSHRLDVQSATGTMGVTSTTGTNISYVFASNTGGAFLLGKDSSTGALTGTAYSNFLYNGSAYPMVFFTNGSERMRIDSSGNVGIGVTPTSFGAGYTVLDVYNGTTGGYILVRNPTHTGQVSVDGTGMAIQTRTSSPITFNVNNAEKMRITSAGNLGVGTTTPDSKIRADDTVNQTILAGVNSNASFTAAGLFLQISRNTTNNSFYAIDYYNLGASAYKFRVADSGNVTNTNNSYGAISDIKLKENIVDATPKLSKLNQVRVVNYNFIGSTDKQLGVVAQELEQIFPLMVEESPDKDAEGNILETTTKSVKYSVFVPMLIKAIQELKAEFDAYKATHP